MSDPGHIESSVTNDTLGLLYSELTKEQAEQVRRTIEANSEQAAEYDFLCSIRNACAVLSNDDELSANTRNNILREARLTADKNSAGSALLAGWRAAWLPLASAAALIALIAAGSWYIIQNPSQPSTPAEPDPLRARGIEQQPIAKSPAVVETPRENTEVRDPNEGATPTTKEVAAAVPETPEMDAQKSAKPTKSLEKKTAKNQTSVNAGKKSKKRRSEAKKAKAPAADEQLADMDLNPLAHQEIAQSRTDGVSAGAGVGSVSGDGAVLNSMGTRADLYAQGLTSFNQKEYEEAVASFTEVIGSPTAVSKRSAHYYRGLSYHKLGMLQEAISDLRNAVDAKSAFAHQEEALFALAECLIEIGSVEDARQQLLVLAEGDSSLSDRARDKIDSLDVGGGGTSDTATAREKPRTKDKKKQRKAKSKGSKRYDFEAEQDSATSF